jgi:hypothetical protein
MVWSHRVVRQVCIAALLLGSTVDAGALTFRALTLGNGRKVLFIYDCGRPGLPTPPGGCAPYRESFSGDGWYKPEDNPNDSTYYRGDTAELTQWLASGSFSEVWLYSGGGNLQTGVEIGRLLRRERMTVRVPNRLRVERAWTWTDSNADVICASSCTVAFMGGQFRYMDVGASYMVHSASAVSGSVPRSTLERMLKGDFMGIARSQQITARFRAIQLLVHFQNTLALTLGTRPLREDDDAFYNWAQSSAPPLPYTATDAERDTQRAAKEGLASFQDLLMRIERDAMQWAIHDLESVLGNLGPRAKPALRMVRAMYDVAIVDVQSLSMDTMLDMGYLTQNLNLDPNNP